MGRREMWVFCHLDRPAVELGRAKIVHELLRQFADNRTAPFGIHQIALMGVAEGKAITDWFGPNTIAQVLRKLCRADRHTPLGVHVAMDNVLVVDDVHRMLARRGDREDPALVLLPLRLGLSRLNAVYAAALHSFFSLPQCAGILGGRPNHALYFTGSCNGHLLYLDPHTVQEAVNMDEPEVSSSRGHQLPVRLVLLPLPRPAAHARGPGGPVHGPGPVRARPARL